MLDVDFRTTSLHAHHDARIPKSLVGHGARRRRSEEIMQAQQAISQSIATNSIVHIDGNRTVMSELSAECESSVEIRGDEGVELVEYRGTDENGQAWRVHVRPDGN